MPSFSKANSSLESLSYCIIQNKNPVLQSDFIDFLTYFAIKFDRKKSMIEKLKDQ